MVCCVLGGSQINPNMDAKDLKDLYLKVDGFTVVDGPHKDVQNQIVAAIKDLIVALAINSDHQFTA